MDDTRPQERFTTSLLEHLERAPSGTAFIHWCLAAVVRTLPVDEAVLVLADDVVGRQVFTPDRVPPRSAWARWVASAGEPGLHTDPDVVDDPRLAAVVHVATLALRLDVLRRSALIDPLTRVYNRGAFGSFLEQAMERYRRTSRGFTLVLFDVDDFKQVNDRGGHATGDALLDQIGRALRRHTRRVDVAARLGGDEFAVLLEDAEPGTERVLIRRVIDDLGDGWPIAVNLSLGAARCPDDATDADSLYSIADDRLYDLKESRKGRHAIA